MAAIERPARDGVRIGATIAPVTRVRFVLRVRSEDGRVEMTTDYDERQQRKTKRSHRHAFAAAHELAFAMQT